MQNIITNDGRVYAALRGIQLARPELTREQCLESAQQIAQASHTESLVDVLERACSLAVALKPLPWE